jgi:glutaredoxin
MKTVTLLSKADCHLCEIAKEVLLIAQKRMPFGLQERKITAEDPDFETYRERVPVILIDGVFGFQYRVSEQQLLDRLREKD